MLDSSDRRRAAEQLIFGVPCHVRIPASMARDFERNGACAPALSERRRHPRMHCRGPECCAALGCGQSLTSIPRERSWRRVYTMDISKGGVGFLSDEQLFPGEQMLMVLLSAECRLIEVAWCRRLGAKCFRVGAKFLSKQALFERVLA